MPAFKDIAGRRFGALVALERAETRAYSGRGRSTMWRCACDCGREFTAHGAFLRNGRTTSCGCRSDVAAEPVVEVPVPPRRKNRTGHRYGRLVVLGMAPDRRSPDGRALAFWNCLCDCGRTKAVDGGNLTSGRIKSCGCLAAENARRVGLARAGAARKAGS